MAIMSQSGQPGQGKLPADLIVSPLLAVLEAVCRWTMPNALIFTVESDVLRNEGEAYARKLANAGSRGTVVRCNSAIHRAIGKAICALRSAFE